MLVEEKLKENMSKGVFKKGLWSFVQKQFNRPGNKKYHKDQLRQKFQMLKVRHRVVSELIGRSGMVWDSHTKKVIGSEEAWANAIAVSVICVHNNFNVEFLST